MPRKKKEPTCESRWRDGHKGPFVPCLRPQQVELVSTGWITRHCRECATLHVEAFPKNTFTWRNL